jgi:predicted metal-dependent enzyme (double-stranded beta helix superfamily)
MSAARPRPPRSRRDRTSAPISPLNPVELIDLARLVAAEVTAGRYPYIEFDADERWHQRIYRDPRVDIWLISWLPSQGTQLHDHGGSSGAFTVLSGQLTEAVYQHGRPNGIALSEHQRDSGAAIGFGPHYVHDVRNLSTEPATSVHAYSRPLTMMSYYDVAGDGSLDRLLSLATEDPEPEVGLLGRKGSAA